ncbi:MAG: hypothetical protein RL885_13850 [Planctomycetota bacterium]
MMLQKLGPAIGLLLLAGAPAFGQLNDFEAELHDTTPTLEVGASFGATVAIGDINGDGIDDTVVGSPTDDSATAIDTGSIRVFFGPSLTTASLTISNPSNTVSGGFGAAVTIGDVNDDGRDDVIVGAPFSNVGGNPAAGEVWVFFGPFLQTSQQLTEPTPQAGSQYGFSLATGNIDGNPGDEVVIGAPRSQPSGVVGAGAVYVYTAPGLLTVQTLTEVVLETDARFGTAVAVGDVDNSGFADVAVGVPLADPSGVVDAGEVFVFQGPLLSFSAPVPHVNESGAQFGASLAMGNINSVIDGFDDLLVGSPLANPGALVDAGDVTVYLGPNFATSFPASDPNPEAGSEYGRTVALGDVDFNGQIDILIGAPKATVSGQAQAGKVAIASGSQSELFADTPEAGAFFGRSIAVGQLTRDTDPEIVVGAPVATQNGSAAAGRCLVFKGPGHNTIQDLLGPSAPEVAGAFGSSLAVADVTKNKLGDVVTGAPDADPFGIVDAGEVFLFKGPAAGNPIVFTEPTPQAGARYGQQVAIGDVTGDGNLDLVVAAPFASAGAFAGAGEVFVYAGPALALHSVLTEPVPETNAHFGTALTIADFDLDGVNDLAVGVPDGSDAIAGAAAGEVVVFFGPNFSASITVKDLNPEAGARFGAALAAGDIDGNGSPDLGVGAPTSDALDGTADVGEAFLFLGPSFNFVSVIRPVVAQDFGAFGASLAIGELNGDGYDELVIGVPLANPSGVSDAGEVFVLEGPDFVNGSILTAPTPEIGADFGRSLALGDVDNDGNLDLLVGAPLDNGSGGELDAGLVVAFHGPDLATNSPITQPTPEADARFGTAIALGLVNADQADDLAVGMPGAASGVTADAGGVFVSYPQFDFGVDKMALSATFGGTASLSLDAGLANADKPYIILSSLFGTSPGIPLGSVVVPVVFDPFFTNLMLNPAFFPGNSGLLDASGQKTVPLFLPPGVGHVLVGFNTYFAYAAGAPFSYASEPIVITVVP